MLHILRTQQQEKLIDRSDIYSIRLYAHIRMYINRQGLIQQTIIRG